jgi:hypothetical protein
MMTSLMWLVAAACLAGQVQGQALARELRLHRGAYFGQKKPGLTPQPFAPGIISTAAFEFAGTFSADGSEFFFTRRPDHQGSENRIYHTRMIHGQWTRPVLAPFAEDTFEFIPLIAPGGGKMFFYSDRPLPADTGLDGNIWFAVKTAAGWSRAQYLSHPANRRYCMMVSATAGGALYFAGVYGGKRGVFRSSGEPGPKAKLEYLPDEVNGLRPAHPFISADERFLLFDAQTTGIGKPELYVSFRRQDGTWTPAANLGPVINATKTEFAASISPDGRYLFFHRRVGSNGDIYWVDSRVLEPFASMKSMQKSASRPGTSQEPCAVPAYRKKWSNK